MAADPQAEPVGATPGFGAERMAMFTDAIFAIAATLLVIEIKRPEHADLVSPGALGAFLLREWSSFLAFALAFFLLWGVWRRHNALTDQITRWNRATMALHGPLLLLVALLPFPTALVGGEGIRNPLALSVFAGTESALVFCEAAIKECACRAGLVKPGIDPAAVRASGAASIAVGGYFVLTAVLAWWVRDIYFAWIFAPLVAVLGRNASDRLRRRTAAG
ncbi:MAG TPA: TMEM175 family protein [Streptosporangiaceae bacterium]|jgi:uncharacterized membrane protein